MQPALNKLNVVLHETVLDEKPSAKEEFAKVMGKNLTTLDIIGLAVLTMFPQGLFLGPRIVNDNPRLKPGENHETLSKE